MKKLFILLMLLPFVSFAQSSDATLTTSANTIRNETTPGENTALRVGNMFNAIISSKFSRVDDAGLASLENLSTTGIIVQTVANTMVTRALQAGTGISVSNGDGVSGNPSISLSHLGIQSLTDPGADRIFFWDESGNVSNWLQAGTGLQISGTTLSAVQTLQNVFDQGPSASLTNGVETTSTSFGADSWNVTSQDTDGNAINYGASVTSFFVESYASSSLTGGFSLSYLGDLLLYKTHLSSDDLTQLDSVVHLVGRRHSDGELVLRDASTFTGTLDDVLEAGSSAEISSTIDILADDGGATLNWLMDLTGDQFLFDVTNAGVTTEASLRITDPYFSTESAGGFRGNRNSSTNNTPEAVWAFQKTVEGSGGGANGIGARLYLGAESATNNTYRNGYIDFVLTDATAATAEGEFRIYHVTGGSAELALTIGGTDGITDDDVLDRVSASTASGTIDLDVAGKKQRVFTGSASFATAKNLTISNETSKTAALVFTFEITDLAAVLTMETNVLMQDSRFDGDDWTATATGVYKMTGTYDGTNWLCEISANPYQ